MPGFDGTGPQGMGPITGRGEGYCAVVLPESGRAPYGYAGVQGAPVRSGAPVTRPALGARFARGLRPMGRPGRGFGRGRRRGARGGRGRRSAQW